MRLRRPVLPHQTDSGNQRAAFRASVEYVPPSLSAEIREQPFVPQGICTPISLFLHKETVVPAREKRFTPTVCSRKRSPIKGEKLSP